MARLLLVMAVVAGVAALALVPAEQTALPPRDGPAISTARSWGYQLQNVDLTTIAVGVDMLVVDYSRDGSERRVLRPAEIDRLRTRADGSKRIVLAYLSIGEAESYRYYWRRGWKPGQPSWLGPENTEWRGNYAVRYWLPGWRDVIMQPHATWLDRVLEAWQPVRKAYLDRIIEAGFDGVYLDRVDAFDHWEHDRPEGQADMVAFVTTLSRYAKLRRPGFLVVPQNGEELLRFAEYRRAIDAVAKEDLVFGVKGDGKPNTEEEVARGIADLDRLRSEGRPVFVVEYLTDPLQRADVQRRTAPHGYIVQFASRDLRRIPE
jgi:cysteinyl-tRNA synthetase, unknown class